MGKHFRWFQIFLIISVFLSGAMALIIVLYPFLSMNDSNWKFLLEINEFVTVLIYLFFLLADCNCLKACDIALEDKSKLNENGKKILKPFRTELKNYILACDAPGLLGILLITALSFLLSPVLSGYYWQGFVIGAIGLHITFSQSTLAFISINDFDS